MKEREDIQAQIPLFDEIPQELKQREDLIKQTFDGTLGTRGITMVLNPLTGAVIMARLVDLKTGRISSYEPLSRGKWANITGDLEEGSSAYKKLDRVYEDVRDKLMLWKIAHPGYGPMREWTTAKGKKYENLFDSKIILPEEWYERVLKPIEEKRAVKEIGQELPKKNPRERRLRRTWQSQVVIDSKDMPRVVDARPSPAILRKNSDRDIKRVLLDKGPLGKRVRRAVK